MNGDGRPNTTWTAEQETENKGAGKDTVRTTISLRVAQGIVHTRCGSGMVLQQSRNWYTTTVQPVSLGTNNRGNTLKAIRTALTEIDHYHT